MADPRWRLFRNHGVLSTAYDVTVTWFIHKKYITGCPLYLRNKKLIRNFKFYPFSSFQDLDFKRCQNCNPCKHVTTFSISILKEHKFKENVIIAVMRQLKELELGPEKEFSGFGRIRSRLWKSGANALPSSYKVSWEFGYIIYYKHIYKHRSSFRYDLEWYFYCTLSTYFSAWIPWFTLLTSCTAVTLEKRIITSGFRQVSQRNRSRHGNV